MLANLKIENVAVIEKAEVHFTPGFNVLTGETGAGKSILIQCHPRQPHLARIGAQRCAEGLHLGNI